MSQTLQQIFVANPIITNTSTDLIYFSQSPYTAGNDAAMTYANFEAQFAPAGSVASGTINQLAWYSATGAVVSGLATANNGTLITSAAGVPSISSTLPIAVQDNITALGTIGESVLVTLSDNATTRLLITNASTGTSAIASSQLTNNAASASFNLYSSTYTPVPSFANRLLMGTDSGIINGILMRAPAGGFTVTTDGSLSTANLFVNASGNVTASGSVSALTFISSADSSFNGMMVGRGLANISSNNVFGSSSMGDAATTGTSNTAIGDLVLRLLTSGTSNIGIGANSLERVTTGSSNLSIGTSACAFLTIGQKNIALGSNSLISLTTGIQNTCIGVSTGRDQVGGAVALTTGSSNTLIGLQASCDSSSAVGTLALGVNALALAATGVLSSDDGAGISIGSASFKVGFRGDGTIYPTAGAISGYMIQRINGVQYKVALYDLS